jgi:hypothetical protein
LVNSKTFPNFLNLAANSESWANIKELEASEKALLKELKELDGEGE